MEYFLKLIFMMRQHYFLKTFCITLREFKDTSLVKKIQLPKIKMNLTILEKDNRKAHIKKVNKISFMILEENHKDRTKKVIRIYL